jgi:hypothetical protein
MTWNTGRFATAATRPGISPYNVMPIVPTTMAHVRAMPKRAPVMPLVTRLPTSTKSPMAVKELLGRVHLTTLP